MGTAAGLPQASTAPLGLTSAEADERRQAGLGNDAALPTSRPLWLIVRANVCTRFNAILGVLMAVIIIVGPFQDGLFAIVLVLNTLIGIAQELRAKRTLDRLALLSAPTVRAWRDGAARPVAVHDLVVDDVVELARGDQVPLDGVVLAVGDGGLELDESLLTGESAPVARAPGEDVRSGSFVSAGDGRYRATRPGRDSFAQALAGEARKFAPARSELTDGVNQILRLVQWAVLPTGTALVVSQLVSHKDLADAIRGCVAGISAMIPEGLVLLTSITFAIGALRLARRRVLARELPAVEGLARVDVICFDKTGTLTRGGIMAESAELLAGAPGEATPVSEALGALAHADANPNPTLAAIAARWPAPAGWDASATVPFSSARRWSGADFGPRGVWALGAPELFGQAAVATGSGRTVVLAVAPPGTALERERPPAALRPVAVVHLAEQLRPDAPATVAYFAAQGVGVRVMSGDHPATVSAIAAAAGVAGADRPVDASAVDEDELARLVLERTVFARVAPAQKRAMVRALQQAGHTVAMTGDGVNDVLALKDADVGIAMGSGSAATRTVAQLVLLDDEFADLPVVIAEGRRVMANIERVANLFLTKTAYATLIAFVVAVAASAYPFLPRHITVISDFSIGIPAFFLALLPNARRFRPGFVPRVLAFALPCGAVCGAAALAAYYWVAHGLPLAQARTTATLVLVACGLWVLVLLARPFTPYKTALVGAMAAGVAALVAIPGLRHFFALDLPPAARAAWGVLDVVVAGALLEGVYHVQRQRAGLDGLDGPASAPPASAPTAPAAGRPATRRDGPMTAAPPAHAPAPTRP
jgi:cation-transporting ATPase E